MKFIKCNGELYNVELCSSFKEAETGVQITLIDGTTKIIPTTMKNIVKELDIFKQGDITDPKMLEKYNAPVFEEAETLADITNIIGGSEEEVYVKLTEDLTLETGSSITVPAGKAVTVNLDSKITCTREAFKVEDGGTLVLKGKGTITTTTKSTQAAISADGKGALVVVDGVTIDTVADKGKVGNYAYGIYLLNDANVEFKSGTIKCAYGSCISTNNTTNGATTITVSGGELLCDGSYAIYLPSQATVNITGGKVQGINARMGIFNISGNAEIIAPTITDDDYDNIGLNINTSGCIWFGDTIAVVAGTYTDPDGTDCKFHISGDATVRADYRAAIGIYQVDTKEDQNVEVIVEKASNVTTTAEGFEHIMVYDHDYIQAEATANGKTYTPTANSTVEISTNGSLIE